MVGARRSARERGKSDPIGAVAVLVLLIGPLTLAAGTFRRRELSSAKEPAANPAQDRATRHTTG
jgi:hypothetical protein